MRFEPILTEGVKVPGAAVLIAEPLQDDRGFFTRLWSDDEAEGEGIVHDFTQLNLAFNRLAGTLRGMHFQIPPHAETKLVRVMTGAVWDVILDLRTESPTYLCWFGCELSRLNRRALLLPVGCAHGYQTLVDETEVMYQTTHRYVARSASGVRHDDPAFSIDWPLAVSAISSSDQSWPVWTEDDDRRFGVT